MEGKGNLASYDFILPVALGNVIVPIRQKEKLRPGEIEWFVQGRWDR